MALIFLPLGASAAADQAKPTTTVVIIGDSLTQGYGVKETDAFPALLPGELAKLGLSGVRVINAGISGSVTAEADRRVRFYSRLKPQLVMICLGGNDALKGTPAVTIEQNLRRGILAAKEIGAQVALCAMRIFSNYGATYSKEFESLYPRLAREEGILLTPFILEGVALDSKLMLPDAKHPNEKGHVEVARRLAPHLARLLSNRSKASGDK